ncbi:bile acid:sodium symporter [Rubinisphaera sp. ICM_H10]|nr:bile acid:sodium symporter [Rubinisphaera margarita]
MTNQPPIPKRLEQMLQRYLLPGIALVYGLAAIFPAPGVWLRTFEVPGSESLGLGPVTAVNLLLAGLLFNTGLAVPARELLCLTRHPKLIVLGLSIRVVSCCLIIALAIAGGVLFAGNTWDLILLGVILVAVMPVANSSAAWTHHSEANVGLSMWLIVISVLLSPILVPGLVGFASRFVNPEFISEYAEIGRGYAGSFVMTWVIIPAALGVLVRSVFIRDAFPRMKLTIKIMTSLFLLVLNYANGAVSLPEILAGGNTLLILLVAVSASILCGLLFVAAWLVSRLCRLPRRDRLAVMYSTAMSNTGVALVLVTAVLPAAATLHLVIIFYTLVQHIVAGLVDEVALMMDRRRQSPVDSCTMTSQPVLNDPDGRPTTQTGSHAAMYDDEPVSSKGSV